MVLDFENLSWLKFFFIWLCLSPGSFSSSVHLPKPAHQAQKARRAGAGDIRHRQAVPAGARKAAAVGRRGQRYPGGGGQWWVGDIYI